MRSSHPVVRRLSWLAPLSEAVTAAIEDLEQEKSVPAGSDVLDEGAAPKPLFLVRGWGARVRGMADGRRQIISFLLPGDALGFCERPQPLSLAPVVALTPLTFVDAATVARLAYGPDAPDLRAAVHIGAAMEEAGLMDQIVRLGRQSALERMAHLFLDLRFRLSLIDAVADDAFDLPLTQEHLADALGLTAVHVNRTLQTMRADGLIQLGKGRLHLRRSELLEAIADYRPPEVTRWRSIPFGRHGTT